MSVKDHLPDLVQSFIDHAKLFTALSAEMNADTHTEKTVVTHFATGDKYDVVLKVTKQKNICQSPEHNPPMEIYLEPGQYTWKCPECGEEQTFVVPLFTN